MASIEIQKTEAVSSLNPLLFEAGLKLRRMHRADLEAVHWIERHSFSDPWSFNSFKEQLKPSRCNCPLVLVPNSSRGNMGCPVGGYLILWYLEVEIHIANIAIHPDLRRQGWAEKMIRTSFFLGQQWGVWSYLLEVRMSNMAARNLYEKLGFEKIAVRKGYYRQPKEDALVLQIVHPPEEEHPPIPCTADVVRFPEF
jgi:[ribosomal protein S18]-alanine N-acetyltransferase